MNQSNQIKEINKEKPDSWSKKEITTIAAEYKSQQENTCMICGKNLILNSRKKSEIVRFAKAQKIYRRFSAEENIYVKNEGEKNNLQD